MPFQHEMQNSFPVTFKPVDSRFLGEIKFKLLTLNRGMLKPDMGKNLLGFLYNPVSISSSLFLCDPLKPFPRALRKRDAAYDYL